MASEMQINRSSSCSNIPLPKSRALIQVALKVLNSSVVLNAIGSDLERQAHTANQSAKLVLALFGFNTNDNLLPDLLIASYFH